MANFKAVQVLVEIPKGTVNNKYERDPKTGEIVLDFVFENLVWPFNYGEIESTMGGDGDRLDAVVFSSEPLKQGLTVKCLPFGVVVMLDRGERDDKVLMVPEGDVLAQKYGDIGDMSEGEKKDMEQLYMEIARQKKKNIQILSFESKKFAQELINKSRVQPVL